jgi:ABC-2 type transport system ATP-binding protein
MNTPAIRFENLTKSFGRGNKRVRALRNLDLDIPAGEVYGFLGPNGAGKTTTIRLLMDLIRPEEGRAFVFGQEVDKHPEALKRVGALVEDAVFYNYLSGHENLKVLGYVESDVSEKRIEYLLDQVGLSDSADRRVDGYSTGMKQRLGIAVALLNDPALVVLDEPTVGLDPVGIVEMRLFIRALAEEHGKTIFLSSHLLNEVEQICDRVAIIRQGSLIREGLVKELLSQGSTELRIQATPIDRAREALQQRWHVSIVDDWLHVSVSHEDSPAIVERLVGANVKVRQVVIDQQSLEEYFMDVTAAEADQPEES